MSFCEKCGKEFANNSSFVRHNKYSFSCGCKKILTCECGYETRNEENMIMHKTKCYELLTKEIKQLKAVIEVKDQMLKWYEKRYK